MEVLNEIFYKAGYLSLAQVLKENALIIALINVEKYKAECERFRHEYRSGIDEFNNRIHSTKGKENFKHEEDLEDWEFANKALKWWESKV